MPQPVYGRMYQTPFSDQIRNEAGLATMCVGAITTADQVNTIIAAGRADLVALARPHLVDPYLHHEGGGLVRRARRSIARRNISPAATRCSATARASARS